MAALLFFFPTPNASLMALNLIMGNDLLVVELMAIVLYNVSSSWQIFIYDIHNNV